MWTNERILFFWIAGLLVPLFFTIGVISSMRWTGRQWREFRNNRGARKLNAKYSTVAQANRPLPFVTPAAPFPLRNEKARATGARRAPSPHLWKLTTRIDGAAYAARMDDDDLVASQCEECLTSLEVAAQRSTPTGGARRATSPGCRSLIE